MQPPSPVSDGVVIDGESYSLQQLPLATSRVVTSARRELATQIDLPAFVEDIARVAVTVRDGQSAAAASGYPELSKELELVENQCDHILQSSTAVLENIRSTAVDIQNAMPRNMNNLLRLSGLDSLQLFLRENDKRAEHLGATAESFVQELAQAAERAEDALGRAQSHRSLCVAKQRTLAEDLDVLNIQKDSAWEAHTLVLDSMSDAGMEYARSIRKERAAVRRASVFGLFGWLVAVDVVCQNNWSINALQPVTNMLHAVQIEADEATSAREAILTSKLEQRKLYSQCVEAISDASRRMREAAIEMVSVEKAFESLKFTAAELKRFTKSVQRMTAYWRQVHSSVNRLSASAISQLIDVTRSGVKDFTMSATREWSAGSSLKRRCILYYSHWAAMAAVSEECVRDLERLSQPGTSESTGSSTISHA